MKHFYRAVKSIIFLGILLASLVKINSILEQKTIMINNAWPSTSTYKQFYNMEKDSIDVLFLGSSVVANAFIPQEIYNEYGIRSYNLGAEQQSVFLNYYWLKEALRYQKPKVVVLDLKFMCELHSDNPINMEEGLIRKSLDPMKLSPVKIQAIHDLCQRDKEQSEISYYLTNIRYHGRWEELEEYDFNSELTEYSQLKGYAPSGAQGEDTYETYEISDKSKRMKFEPVMQQYLDKMVKLCKENGIKLVLVDLPGNDMNDAINNTHNSYAKKNGIKYYNLCSKYYFEKIGAVLPDENVVNHQNYAGAIKTSRFIGNILKEEYKLSPIKDKQYDKTQKYYTQVIEGFKLSKINDVDTYFQEINKDNYAVFFSIYGDAAKVLDEEMKKNMATIGLNMLEYIPEETSYVAVVVAGDIAKEEYSEERIEIWGDFRNRSSTYRISSNGKDLFGESSITIDGEEYSNMDAGINIAVYDLNMCKVVDAVTINKNDIIRK